MAAGLAFLHSFESISPYHSNEPPLKYFQACLLQRTKKFEKPLADPIVFFPSDILSDIPAQDCGSARQTEVDASIRHCGEHKLVCGDNRKSLQTAGRRAGTPAAAGEAGRQASSAIMQNAKSVCTANVDKGEPRKKVGGDTQQRTPISCLASKKALTLEIIGNPHEIITILVLDLILYFSTLKYF